MVRNFLTFIKQEWKFLFTTLIICTFTLSVVICMVLAIFNPELLWNGA